MKKTSVRSDFAKERLQASAVHENEIKELKAKLLNLGLKGDEALEQVFCFAFLFSF
jgi:hypothetical protein